MKDELRKLANVALEAAGVAPILSEEQKQIIAEANRMMEEDRQRAARDARLKAEAQRAWQIYQEAKRLNLPLKYDSYDATTASHLKAFHAEEREQEQKAAAERAAQAEAARKKAEAERLAQQQAAEKLHADMVANIEKYYPNVWD